MDDETEFRIDFSITRREPGDADFIEIGFGSSGAWSSVNQCAHMLSSAVERGEWETEPGQPDPADVLNQQVTGGDAE